MHINLPLAEMSALLSHERRVALPFYRDDRKVSYLQFEPAGPVARDLPADSFDRNFKQKVDRPLEAVALTMIGACRTCYLPGSRVMTILMEIFNMTQTNGAGDLNSLSQAQLTETYNKLAEAAKKGTVKSFKDKATAIARIQALQSDVAEPTAQQKKAAAAAAEAEEKAGKPAAKKATALKSAISVLAEATEARQAARKAAAPKNLGEHVAAKKAARAKKEPAADKGEKKPRGQGIGAFACELILKDPSKTNEQVLEAIKAKYPDASTSMSSVAWYRNKLKSEGQLPS